MMTYHPPITTYTPEQEQRMQDVCTMAERMMARGYGGMIAPPEIEPQEHAGFAGDCMTLSEIRKRYGYGYNWLYEHNIPTRVIDGLTVYSAEAICNEHETLRGAYTINRLPYIVGTTKSHIMELREAGLVKPIGYWSTLYDRDTVLQLVQRYPREALRDMRKLKQLPSRKPKHV